MRSKHVAARAAIVAALLAAGICVSRAETAPIVMKLTTATLNDGQHEWMKR